QNRTAETISDVKVLVVIRNPRGEVLDFHLRDFKGMTIPPGLAKQVSIPISTRGFRTWGFGADYLNGTYEIRLLDYRIVGAGGGVPGPRPAARRRRRSSSTTRSRGSDSVRAATPRYRSPWPR